jgi:ArsR family transcriptional regulator, arsenate/arsenite/antimonite-responsive transcriptional repressor / arsenate reductase (thioredoxin)
MKADQDPELLRRAAVHKALGDGGRLAIVDALLHADVSPSQLQAELGMASNLLAHHVRVLEQAGVVQRVRSEGDRRRSYLTLVPGAIAGLVGATSIAAPRVVFVCTENAVRSQLAAALWAEHSTVVATSAGTHPAPQIHPGTIAAARDHNLHLQPQGPRSLDDVLRPEDLLVTVCDRAHEELAATLQHAHWSVADPVPADDAGDIDAFERTLHELTDRVSRLAPAVRGPRQPARPSAAHSGP